MTDAWPPVPGALRPDPSSAQPDRGHLQADWSQLRPDPSRLQPDSASVRPDSSSPRPDPSQLEPDPSSVRPDSGHLQPDPSQLKPDLSSLKPDPRPLQPDSGSRRPRTTGNRRRRAEQWRADRARGMSGYALQANPTYAAGSSSLRPAPSSLRPAPVSLQPGSSSLRPGLRRTRTRGKQRIPPGAMAHRYNGEMSGYAALTRPTHFPTPISRPSPVACRLSPVAFTPITPARPATLGDSGKPLLSRRAAQQRAGPSGAAV